MKPTTRSIIRMALAGDETVGDAESARIVAALDGPATADCLRFRTVADRLGVCARTVRDYARRGLLEPVRIGGKARAIGVTGESLRRLLDSPAKEVNYRQPATQAAGLHGEDSPQLLPAAAGETRGPK